MNKGPTIALRQTIQEDWDRFALDHGTWPYLPLWIEYQRHYAGDDLLEDCSFAVLDQGRMTAVCPLLLVRSDDGPVLSAARAYAPAPLLLPGMSPKAENRIQGAAHWHLDQLAVRTNACKTMLKWDSCRRPWTWNQLRAWGYLDASTQTSIIDLDQDPKALWSRLRKSYKSLINNGLAEYEVSVIDAANPDRAAFAEYQRLHRKAAGRITRSGDTFDIQRRMVEQDCAMLLRLTKDETPVAYSLFLHHAQRAFYGSSAPDPEAETGAPLQHCMIWNAVKYYKERGFLLLETGLQPFGTQFFDLPSGKERSIAFFKRGFGTRIAPLWRGVKYHRPELLQRDLEAQVKRMVSDSSEPLDGITT